jgi:aryl-alcohol dehydrogenase-like predicted oxidoreductase
MKALDDLIKCGKVRYIGASSMRAWQLAHYNNVADKLNLVRFISMQSQYSLLYREEEREMNEYCAFAGIGIIPYGPLASGLLTRSLSADKTRRSQSTKSLALEWDWERKIIRRVEAVAQEKQWTMSQVSIAWIADKVTSPIIGFTSVGSSCPGVTMGLTGFQAKQLEEAIIPGYKLSHEEIRRLEEPYQTQAVHGLQ